MSALPGPMARRIRQAEIGDAPMVGEIHGAAWREAYESLIPDSPFAQIIAGRRLSFWRRWVSEPHPGSLIVIEDDQRPVGYCLFAPAEDVDGSASATGEIVSLDVRPEYWRRGFGRALCDHVLREAPRRAWTRIVLWAIETGPARPFCEALGFRMDGSRRTDTTLAGSPISEVRYQKILSPHC